MCENFFDGESAENVIRIVKTIVNIYPVNRDFIDKAREASVKDFESAVEIVCVTDDNLFSAIVTQTPELFDGAAVPILGVTDLLNRILLERVWGATCVEPTINTALWLQGKFDTDWELVPLRQTSLRSSVQSDLNSCVEILEKHHGVYVPDKAVGVYKDLTLGDNALRLYATKWNLSDFEEELEWTLLIVLAPQQSTYLNKSVSLQISDDNQTLLEETLERGSYNYIYARVIGADSENFWVNISTLDGVNFIPPLCFDSLFLL